MLLSILASDAIALPLSPAFPIGELKYILDNSEAKMLLATEKYEDKARQILNAGLEREPIVDIREKIINGSSNDEPLRFEAVGGQQQRGGMMLYTSGTTNRPVRKLDYEYVFSF
jgi:acyl-coenzyme A synthetase/AMP-(fatty) acid ligase